MAYVDIKEAQAKAMLGKRVEIPVHLDLWMMGARHGQVVGLAWERNAVGEKIVRAVRIKMDHPQVPRQVRVHRIDFDYIKVLS